MDRILGGGGGIGSSSSDANEDGALYTQTLQDDLICFISVK